ncbi:class 1 fructose-bisphosphatase [Gilvimarinus agarilyticus]|uniref:class 1 fructose-bisphosphatase n=1 Tax=Gilvimarinus sp. 2_MG-2023 TaxID=3062666 RepID=UPI001C09F8FF|nr:class 1 fructose-bisphosphatase [Gilvimarinus sp. 2_MG-2023]MBU2886703.1 class 1 fructose-bisphosphatase [Gilvimarinus agarilyticus]MDO6571369.1 class 1 fructose-bisphosphatase [Gilvimarinus sp. 2_MG-2023]
MNNFTLTKTFANFLLRSSVDLNLGNVVNDILLSCIEISELLAKSPIEGLTGSTEKANSSGETQKQLDLLCNQILRDQLRQNQAVKYFASEEESSAITVHDQGVFAVAFDPLDGSTNIDINGSVGTIFSILPALSGKSAEESFLQAGTNQVCAGYVIYGPATQLVITFGRGTYIFTLDPEENIFFQTDENVRVPVDTNEFSINMANARNWSREFSNYVFHLLDGKGGPRQKTYNMRWTGAMVADIHRVISRGGIFLYPSDQRANMSSGKLRLIYEANPMALILENCGASAFNEAHSILSITPTQLHQRVPVIAGSTKEVFACLNYIQNEGVAGQTRL